MDIWPDFTIRQLVCLWLDRTFKLNTHNFEFLHWQWWKSYCWVKLAWTWFRTFIGVTYDELYILLQGNSK